MVRKLLIALGALIVLLAALFAGALATGVITTTSLSMLLNVALGISGRAADAETVKSHYDVPEGFTLSLYTGELPRARFLRFTPAGDLLVSRPHAGDIMLLRRDGDGDGHPDQVSTLIDGLKRPHGIDLDNGWLYIAESNRVIRVRFDAEAGRALGEPETVLGGLTDNGFHWSKTLRVGPDGMLYLAQGSTCNVCREEDPRRATMLRIPIDGGEPEIIATGLRNSVGFDWAPWSGALYATDNGRDLLGDDFPPCELNHLEPGGFYGWPYFNGDNIPDPDMGPDPLAAERRPVAPAHAFQPHNAPLGITFPDTRQWPGDYDRSALVALHGSWNRSSPDGYKVVSLHWTEHGIEERDFLTGFLSDGKIRGRPVDVAQGPDGAVYISDDYAGAIYRVGQATGESVTDAATMAAIVTAAGSRLDPEPPAWLAGVDRDAMAELGDALYQRHGCRSCHEDGENPLSLEGLSNRLGYDAVVETLRAPRSPMPVFPLSEQEQRALAIYLLDR